MLDQHSRRIGSHALSPILFVAYDYGKFRRTIEGIDMFERDVADVRFSFFVADRKDKILLRLYDRLVIRAHVLIVIRETMMRVVPTYFLVVEPVAIIFVQISFNDRSEIHFFAGEELIFHA